MTDIQLIWEYLDKHYKPMIDATGFVFIDRYTGRNTECSRLEFEVNKIFGSVLLDVELSVYQLFKEWFKSKSLTLKLDRYFLCCDVHLGIRQWTVKFNGKDIDIDTFKEAFKREYDVDFLETYYSEWMSNKICDKTERIMGLIK